jgi:hypothetical protein
MKTFKQILESSVSRIWQFVEDDNRSFGIMSSFTLLATPDENEKSFEILKKEIQSLGYGFVEFRGPYQEKPEKSLFIASIKENQLMDLGEKFSQDAVIYKDRNKFVMVGTNQDNYGQVIDTFKKSAGKDNIDLTKDAIKVFYSSILSGRHSDKKFVFKSEELAVEMLEMNSFFRNMLIYNKNKPLQWFKII